MRKGKEKAALAITLPDARQLSDEAIELLRLRAWRGCELGFTQCQVADILGVSRETVCRWWSAYTAAGVEALPPERTGRPKGSGRILSDEQAWHSQQLLDAHSPEDLGSASPWWSRRAIRDLINKEFAIDLLVRTVGKYRQRWGYTAKKPGRHSRDQEPEEVRPWLEVTYPALDKRASAEGAARYGCDETGSQADKHPAGG